MIRLITFDKPLIFCEDVMIETLKIAIIASYLALPFVSKDITAKDIRCMADNMYYESRGEPAEGIFRVGLVTYNRMLKADKSACEIVYQKIDGKPQFSWTAKKQRSAGKLDRMEYEFCVGKNNPNNNKFNRFGLSLGGLGASSPPSPPSPPGGEPGGLPTLPENKENNLNILLESDDIMGDKYIDLSKARNSLGTMEDALSKLLKD